MVAVVSADVFQGDAEEPAVLVCEGDPATWTEAAWEAWSVAEAELAQAMAAGVRVAADATVVTFVDETSVADFQRSSLTWKFPPGTPALIALTGLRAEEVWMPGATPETRVVPLSRKQVDDVPWLLGWLARACTTPRVIFLPCNATPLPGAELWAGGPWRDTAAVVEWSRAARDEEAVTGNRFLPEPFFGMVEMARFAQAAAAGGNVSGWGYDYLPIAPRGIVDSMHVVHTRPVQSHSDRAEEEKARTLSQYGLFAYPHVEMGWLFHASG